MFYDSPISLDYGTVSLSPSSSLWTPNLTIIIQIINNQQIFNSVANPYSLSDRTTINRGSWPFFLINDKNKNNNNNTWPKPSLELIINKVFIFSWFKINS